LKRRNPSNAPASAAETSARPEWRSRTPATSMAIETMRATPAAGSGLLGFLFPQAIAVASREEAAPRDGIVRALIMCTLVALAVYAGWHEPAPARWSAPRQTRYPVRRLYWIGMVALGVGAAGFLKLASLSGGILARHWHLRHS